MLFRFRPVTLDDAEMLLGWRTDPVITRFMYTDIVDPSVDRQKSWLSMMENRQDFRHFIIEHTDNETAYQAIGYLSYSAIDQIHRHCSSGSYIVTDYARRMLSGYLYPFIMDYAFYGMNMHKIINYFMAGNDKVIKIQRLLKHREVGVLKDHIYKYGQFHDVHVFELLESQWRTHSRIFTREQTLGAFKSPF